MQPTTQNEARKEFQLERMILFSDAVFAIAITLLVIEIKVPELHGGEVTNHALLERTAELIPKFIGFLVSFLVIGIYWVSHHRMFGFVVRYNQRLLWLNLVFLLAVVLMPFSSAFYSEYLMYGFPLPIIVYFVNIVFLGIMNLTLWNYISQPAANLTEGITPETRRYYRFRAAVPIVVFVGVAVMYLFVSPLVAVWMPMLIIPVMRIMRRRMFREEGKAKPVKR